MAPGHEKNWKLFPATLNKGRRDMGACSYYENRKSEKMAAAYLMESCNDCASVKKQTTGRCMCEDQKQNNKAKKKRHAEYMRQY